MEPNQLGKPRTAENGPSESWAANPRSVTEAVDAALAHVLSLQLSEGHWCGLLEGDTSVESEYILLLYFFGRIHEPRVERLAAWVRSGQNEDGLWSLYLGGPGNVSSSVKAYFVLKLVGDDPEARHMRQAREAILSLGGVEAANTYTRFYLALFCQYPWEQCPAISPEFLLVPRWFPINLSAISSWSRGIFVPLSVIWALKPQKPVPDHAGIEELFCAGRCEPSPTPVPQVHPVGRAVFFCVDVMLKAMERWGIRPLRRLALLRTERWIRERLDGSAGLGAIFPAIANAALALRALGLHPEHPAVKSQLKALEDLEVEVDGDRLRLQPCHSPVWDTANVLNIIRVAGLDGGNTEIERAVRWLLDHEVSAPGDWRDRNLDGPISGWYFEYANEQYPDCDDTAEVLTAMHGLVFDDDELNARLQGAMARGTEWLLSMQNRDGGWAAFDRDCDLGILTQVPFADHNAMIDPSCEDITGRVLETLGAAGHCRGHAAVESAIDYLLRQQSDDGTWYGRWGCNYIYGTWLALNGLAAVGVDLTEPRFQRSAEWLCAAQNPDGGWGESLDTYDDPTLKGQGPSTATQTAWALLALECAGHVESAAARRGVEFLQKTQREDGSWEDSLWTGTGFPRVFYLRYDLYDDYFPLLALVTYTAAGWGDEPNEEAVDASGFMVVRG